MNKSYSFSVSEQLEKEGMPDEERLVQTVRAEIYDQTPMVSGERARQLRRVVRRASEASRAALRHPILPFPVARGVAQCTGGHSGRARSLLSRRCRPATSALCTASASRT